MTQVQAPSPAPRAASPLGEGSKVKENPVALATVSPSGKGGGGVQGGAEDGKSPNSPCGPSQGWGPQGDPKMKDTPSPFPSVW